VNKERPCRRCGSSINDSFDIEESKPGNGRQESSPGHPEYETGEMSTRQEDGMNTEQYDRGDLSTSAKTGNSAADNRNGTGTLQEQREHDETGTRGPVIDTTVLDNIRALQREGAPDLVGKLVTLYLTEASAIISTLGTAVNKKNTQDFFRLAHKLKSSSANVGALYLSSLLKSLEALGRQNEIEGTAGLFAAIKEEFETVRKSLEALIPGAVASR
jgi:HPt (histidine-containing phosphotransfer) domain-containing protein